MFGIFAILSPRTLVLLSKHKVHSLAPSFTAHKAIDLTDSGEIRVSLNRGNSGMRISLAYIFVMLHLCYANK